MNDIPAHIRIHEDETARVVDLLIQLGEAADGDAESPAAATVNGSKLRAARIASTLAQETCHTTALLYALACGNSDSPQPPSSRPRRDSKGPVCK